MAMAEGLEGNRGGGVSHGEKLNSHLTMFNGLDGTWLPTSRDGTHAPSPASGRGLG